MRLAAILFALVCMAASAVGAAARDLSPAEAVPQVVAGILFVTAGVVASTRRPDTTSGRLLTLTGLAWLASVALTTSVNPVLFTVGLALFPLGLAPLGHLAVTFPSGRTSSRLERLVVVVPYGLAVASLPVINAASCSDCSPDPVGLDIGQGLGRLWYSTLLVTVLATTVGVLLVLLRRWRTASPVARRVLLPVVPGACAFAVAYLAAILAELGIPTGLGKRWALVGLSLIALAPVVFLGGLLRSRLARAGVGELIVDLGESTPDGLREALAGALGDPSLDVAHWVAERGGYVGSGGSAVDLTAAHRGRSVALIERNGRKVGALIYDDALGDDSALVDAVSAAAGLAMENERLHAEVLVQLEDVRASRLRIVEAADTARRQVERDLHDGAQQRLVTLALAVGMARSHLEAAPDPVLGALLRQASDEATLALRELRDLARGLNPTALRESGLAAAVECLAERSTAPVDLDLTTEQPLPAPVEVAAYYVVSESLANAAKHGQATAVSVRIKRQGDRLVVEVADDGVGGARSRAGSGLQGLADRVAALDGSFEVWSPAGEGTRVRVELPCG